MIVRFGEKNSNIVLGLLIQKYEDTFYGTVFNMNIEEVDAGLTNPKFKHKALEGLLREFSSHYIGSLETIMISPVIGESEYKQELLEALKHIRVKQI